LVINVFTPLFSFPITLGLLFFFSQYLSLPLDSFEAIISGVIYSLMILATILFYFKKNAGYYLALFVSGFLTLITVPQLCRRT